MSMMSPDDYKQMARERSLAVASRPSPSEVMDPDSVIDGRFYGDDIWSFLTPTCAATADHAAKISAVNFCVSTIAETIGSLPHTVMDGDKEATNFELADVIAYAPNPLQTGAEFWASMAFRAALAGQSFAEPVISAAGDVELWPLHPERYEVEWKERSFRVRYMQDGTRERWLAPQQLFWISGLSDACMKPLVPWKMAKGSLDFALALETQGRSFFQNGTKLSGVLQGKMKLSPEAIGRLKEGIRAWRNGSTPVLEEGLEYKSVASTNIDSQLAELIKQRTLELSRYWRIPRSMIGEDGGTAASQEQQALEFVKYTIRPWTRRIEQAISRRLFTPDQQQRYRAKLNLDGLLRGDSATQFKNAVLARTAGTHSTNEIRKGWFGLPEINEVWANDPRAPLNSNRAADTLSGGQTSPQDMQEGDNG